MAARTISLVTLIQTSRMPFTNRYRTIKRSVFAKASFLLRGLWGGESSLPTAIVVAVKARKILGGRWHGWRGNDVARRNIPGSTISLQNLNPSAIQYVYVSNTIMRASTVMTMAAFARSTLVTSFPVPREYQRIHEDLYGFLVAARDKADVETTHRSYTMCQSVFQVFRRRLEVEEAIRFSNSLPAGIRALFVADWDDINESKVPFDCRTSMTEEVWRLRPTHNFAPDTAISDVAYALRQIVDEERFENVLKTLPPEAKVFWTPIEL